MATTTEYAAHANVRIQKGRKPFNVNEMFEKNMEYALIKAIAEELVERGVLTAEEGNDFSVQTAQHSGVKTLENP